MILDLADDRLPSASLEYDLVVVGTGPASSVVVAELTRLAPGLKICVLESGRRRPWTFANSLRKAPSKGIRIKPHSRERVVGGASTTWSGLSSPMDPIELIDRAWLEAPGWPFEREELDPFYTAAERYRFSSPTDFDPRGDGPLGSIGKRRPHQPSWEGLEEKLFLAADPPQNFGEELADVFEAANTTLLLDASVIHLEHADQEVTGARIKTSNGLEHRIIGRCFVVGTGGIENARLLLLSGLGGKNAGHYMMNHPKNYAGIVHLNQPTRSLPYFFGCITSNFAGYAGLRLTDECQQVGNLVNSYVRFEPLFPWSDNRGVEALVHLVKRAKPLLAFWKSTKKDELIELRDYSETGDDSELDESHLSSFGLILRITKHLPSVLAYVKCRVFDRGGPMIHRIRVRNFMEMEPRFCNRVELSDQTDALGTRLPQVVHNTSQRDRDSLKTLHEVLKIEIKRTGFGRLEGALCDLAPGTTWPIDQDASHHMGTTRMGTDPATSVCNPNLLVHGTKNLYMSGASVFPTSGCANPTYTIVALAIRLAEQLAKRFQQEPANPKDQV